jgi:polar amino acid transport system substrate-binding protein
LRTLIRLIAVLLCAAGPAVCAAAADCVKTVRWTEAPPYSSRSAGDQIHGSEADLLREALRRMGCSVKFVDLPWGRALDDLRHGRLNILPGVFRTKERDAFALFSQPVNRTRNIVFFRKSVLTGRSFESLGDVASSDLRLGYVDKADYGESWSRAMQDAAFQARLTPVTNPPAVWRMINAGRLDAAVEDEVTGLTEIAAQGLSEEIVPSHIVISDRPDQIAFSRVANTPDFVARFNHVLDDMKQDGSFLAILQRNRLCKVSLAALGCA